MITGKRPEEVARRYLTEVVSEGRMELLKELVDENVINHDPASDETLTPEEARGFEGFRRHVEAIRTGMPDVEVTIEDVIADDDAVAVRFTVSGTHEGPVAGVEPTGNAVSMSGIVIYRVEDGKIVERWSETDDVGMMRQLGALPDATERTAKAG